MKRLLYSLVRMSGIFILVSIIVIILGTFLQMKKANIDDGVSSRYFDFIMHVYYLGTKIKSIGAWTLIISLAVGAITGILYMIKR